MDLETLERCWQAEAGAGYIPALKGADMQAILRTRTEDLHRRIRSRLRQEAMAYLPTLAVVIVSFWGKFTLARALWAIFFVALLGGLMAVLWQAERRLADVRPDRALRAVLGDLSAIIDGAGRAYLVGYVALFVGFVGAAAGAVWWLRGAGAWLLLTLVAGAAAVVWSHWSGRRYVDRLFRVSREELRACLRDLEAS